MDLRFSVSSEDLRAPSISTSPSSGAEMPRIMRMRVVLPAPFLPMSPYISPRMTVMDTPSTLRIPPKDFVSEYVAMATLFSFSIH